jgi:preprotein translocase subunit SecE
MIVLLSLLMLVGSILGYYYFDSQPAVIRAVGVLVGVAASLFVFTRSPKGAVVWEYVRGSRTEIRKMVWPTRQETLQTTLIIGVFVLVFAIFLWLLDMALVEIVQFLTGRGDA